MLLHALDLLLAWHPSLELFSYGCNVLDQHPFHCLPISVSMHDCWIVSICMLSGDGGWQVRDAGVEEKGWQDSSLWDAVDDAKVHKQFDNYFMFLTLHQSRNIKKAFSFANM